MATTTEAIKRLKIEATTSGFQQATDSVRRLGSEYEKLSPAAQRYQESTERAQRLMQRQSRLAEEERQRLALQQQMLIQMAAANDNVARSSDSAAQGFHVTGIEAANAANHLKSAAIAAYAVSPAFRAMVNPAITASVKASALAMAAMGPAAASAASAVFKGFAPLLALFGRLALPIVIVRNAIQAMTAITELGAQKMQELQSISEGAGSAGVGSDYFQRQAKGAEDLAIKTDLATTALKKFKDVSEPQLGGSSFDNRLDALTKAGNFANNAGVAAYKQAVTVEEKYRAASEIVTIAIQQGERLAGLDLASKFLPPEMMERLRANGELLREMQRAADEVKPIDLVSQQQIGYAAELNKRMEDANKILENGWKPVQKDLTQLGLQYQESMVAIRETMAVAVTHATAIYSWLKGIPDALAAAGNAPFWGQLSTWLSSKAPAWMSSTPEAMGIKPASESTSSAGSPARSELSGWLRDAIAVNTAMQNMNAIVAKVRGDLSKQVQSPPPMAKAAQETSDSVDRMLLSLNRQVEMQKAETSATGINASAWNKLRTQAARSANDNAPAKEKSA